MKENRLGPITTKLAGIIKIDNDIDYKKEYGNMVFEKYSIKELKLSNKKIPNLKAWDFSLNKYNKY
jgi:hypothetical protein